MHSIFLSFIFVISYDYSQQLKQDCEELEKLLKLATRSNVRQLIASEITTLQGKIPKLEEELKPTDTKKDIPNEKQEGTHLYTQKIQSYGKDLSMSKKFRPYLQ